MDDFYHDIKHLPIFDGIDDEAIRVLKQAVTILRFKKGDLIEFSSPETQNLYFIKSGHVKITEVSPEGQEMILDIAGQGEMLGELSYVEELDDVTELIYALDDVSICSIEKSRIERLVLRYPQLQHYMTRRLGLRLRKIEERMKDILYKDVRSRIASFLVRHTEEFGRMKQQSIFIKPYLSHHDIALIIGSTRQTVTSTLNEFRTQGVIDFSRQGFTINDYERLKQLAA